MLQIDVPDIELFDDEKQEFIKLSGGSLQLEHSLLSLSKWESKWCKPFLDKNNKTDEEIIDYIRCMTINRGVNSEVYNYISENSYSEISNYINAPMTATWFTERETNAIKKETITSEIIYYWMISQNIPMECQKWHLNRLLTLIRVCSIKNSPPKKMGRNDMLTNRRALNEARRKQLNSKG